MKATQSKKLFVITVEYESGRTKIVKVRAVSRDVAERKALKFNPTAKGIHRG